MGVLDTLEPKEVLRWFEEISAVPRASLREEKIAGFIMDFARKRGLFCREDESHNVVVRKEASPDRIGQPPLILQSHTDMICAKEDGCCHDFSCEGLQLYIDGDKIRARGTTLGADNGIGVALQLAMLDDPNTFSHPPLEAVFTTAEEIGMIGAAHMNAQQLCGRRMINFDAGGFTEGRIYVGCAGNQHAALHRNLRYTAPGFGEVMRIDVYGLLGGHSGGDIHEGRGNGSVILGRLLRLLLREEGSEIISFESGEHSTENKNGIPARAEVTLLCSKPEKLRKQILAFSGVLRDELRDVDDAVSVSVSKLETAAERVLTRESALAAAELLLILPNGVQSMQRVFADTPECSCNIGSVEITDGVMEVAYSIRSCKDSLIDLCCERLMLIAGCTGTKLELGNRLPTWDYDPSSRLKKLVEEEYLREFGREPRFKVTHASTECAIFKKKIPEMDIISMGPIIYNEHTVREYLGIESVGVLWHFVKELVSRL